MHPTSVSMLSLTIVFICFLTPDRARGMDEIVTTFAPAPTTDSPVTTDMVMMSDEAAPSSSSSGSGSKSAQLNLPGFGNLDLSLFRLPGFSAGSGGLPNLTLPTLPSLPKLFSEVPCVSLLSARAGTCRKADDCISSHGLPDGPCALSLGVCCTRPFTCGQTIIGNETIITSPGFPEPSVKSDICSITIVKGLEVVQIRLDLEVFDIAGADQSGVCSEDVMVISGANSDAVVPSICGMNQGQHIYVPVDKTAILSPLMIKFTFAKTSSAHRLFKIRVTQLKKDHPDLAPAGCMQYYNGKQGVVRSFNYEHVKDVGIRTIKGMKYGVCFRKEKEHCKVKLNPTYTRVTRSAAPAAASSPARYGYYPAAAAQSPVYHQRSHGPAYAPRHPVYLNRPVLMMRPYYYQQHARAGPVYKQHQGRPIVYLPMPPVKSNNYYYYPTEKKVELVDKKKEEIDGLLAKKKLLIEELSTLLKLPAIPELPSLPTLAPLPTLPSLTLPTLPSLPTLTIPKIPTLEELLAKKVDVIEAVKEKIEEKVEKKVDPYYQHPVPAHYYKPAVVDYNKPSIVTDLKEKKVDALNELLAGKQELLNNLLGASLHKPAELKHGSYDPYKQPEYNNYNKPSIVDLKEKKVEALNELLAGKKELVNHLLGVGQNPVQHGHGAYGSYKPTITDLKEKKVEVVNELLNKIPSLSLLSPLPTFPSMISKDAYGLIVDNDHAELGRGFSISYKEECPE